ncbi:MAG: LamG-like jellyroll fold domain-containing protein [Pseudomonadota bacterium]
MLIRYFSVFLLFFTVVVARADLATWGPSEGADGYRLYFTEKFTRSVQYIEITPGSASSREFNIHSGMYEAIITAYNEAGESGPSNMVEYYVPPFSSLRFVTSPSSVKFNSDTYFGVQQKMGRRLDPINILMSGSQGSGLDPAPPAVVLISEYRFDPSALTTDALGANTPVNYGVGEASGRADFLQTEGDYFQWSDATLSNDFPFKSGTSNTSGTFLVDVEIKSLPTAVEGYAVISKFNNATNSGSFVLGIRNSNDTWKFRQQNASGFTTITCPIVPVPGRIYKTAVSYNGSTNSVLIMIFDTVSQSLIDFDPETTGIQSWQHTFTEPMVLDSTPLRLGAYADPDSFLHGYLDNFRVYNVALTADEILTKFLED